MQVCICGDKQTEMVLCCGHREFPVFYLLAVGHVSISTRRRQQEGGDMERISGFVWAFR